jgi:hypothetical protein
MLQRIALLLPGLLLAATAGCGNRAGQVQGVVYIDGKPANDGTVIFSTADHKSAAGAIRPDGHFELSNVPAGPVKVAIHQMVMLGGGPAKQAPLKGLEQPANTPGDPIPIPKKYQSTESSGLSYTIVSGRNELIIELLSE